jgi:hypothetical protein
MKTRPPVRPAETLLPLRSENLSWKQFETFSEQMTLALVNQRPIHFGKQGEKQHAIDAYVDAEPQARWTLQFRQVGAFRPASAKKLVKETTIAAVRHFVFVACEVSTTVRKFFEALPEWELWDIRDISLYVRTMPPEQGRRLVYQFAGDDWVRNFFKEGVVATFASPQLFFAPRGQADPLRHDLPMIGRQVQLEELTSFVRSDAKAAVISGRGGIGKSRVLRELSAMHSDWALSYVTGMTVTATSVSELPLTPTIIVVDDAHEREDMTSILEIVRQRPLPTKLIVATRSTGVDAVQATLSRYFAPAEVAAVTPLDELDRAETKALLRAIVGDHEQLIALLTPRVMDSPVLAVVAARLAQTKALNIAALSSDEDVRLVVFSRFQEEMLGRATDVDIRFAHDLLTLTAALGPVQLDGAGIRTAMASFLNTTEDELVRAMDSLLAAGVLRRRGTRTRITPDVLSDFILEKACITRDRRPTGYATRIFQTFREVAAARLLRNLGEVDWRVRREAPQSAALLRPIWDELMAEFQSATVVRRAEILEIVKAVAAYQPADALRFVEYAVRKPVEEISELEAAFHLGAETVLRHLPSILTEIAFHIDFLPRCVRLLWELGRDNRNELGPNPGHPIRLLAEMAGFSRFKPVTYQTAVVNAVARLIDDPDVHDHHYSVLDIISAALARSGTHTWSEEAASFTIGPFTITRKGVVDLRAHALAVVRTCLGEARLDVSLRAASVLAKQAHAVESQMGGHLITDEQQDQWKPDRLDALATLQHFLGERDESIVQLEVLDEVEWIAFHDSDSEVRASARTIVDAVLTRANTAETRVLVDGFGNKYELHDSDPGHYDFEKAQQAHSTLMRDTAVSLISRLTPESFLVWSAERMRMAEHLRVRTSPGPFLSAVAHAGGAPYATAIARGLLADPQHPLASYVHTVLAALADADSSGALALAQEAINTRDTTLAAGVGAIFAADREFTDDEKTLLRQLLLHADPGVRRTTLGWIRWALKQNLTFVSELLRTFEIGGDVGIAKQLGELFNQHNIAPAELPVAVLEHLIGHHVALLELDDYWIGDFISGAASVIPGSVVQMFLDRIALAESDEAPDRYDAIPFQLHFDSQAIAARDDYKGILRTVRDALLPRTPLRSWDVPKLFVALAVLDHPTTLALLNEWFDSGDAEKIEAASKLLCEAPHDFAFAHRRYIASLLDNAWNVSEDCYNRAASNLVSPVICEMKRGSHGQAFPQDEHDRDAAAAAMSDLEPHGPAWRFFESIRQHAEGQIEQKKLSDEDLEDEYLAG